MLSNLVFSSIDEEIKAFCNERLVTYTRYADDLVFSCNTKNTLVETYSHVNELLFKNGYRINKAKTKYLSGKGRMQITGININEGRLTVPKDIKRNVRSSLHNYIVKNDGNVNINCLCGYLSFIRDIEPEYYTKLIVYQERLKEKARKKRELDELF